MSAPAEGLEDGDPFKDDVEISHWKRSPNQ